MFSAVRMALRKPMNDRFMARSLMVAVWTSFSSKIRSMAAEIAALLPGLSMRLAIQPTSSLRFSGSESFR